jgi:hypothetical protein
MNMNRSSCALSLAALLLSPALAAAQDLDTVERTGPPSTVVVNRTYEHPYRRPDEAQIGLPGKPIELDPAKGTYLWVVDEAGAFIVAPENGAQGFNRRLKHGDLVPGPGGLSRGIARIGGELQPRPDGTWEMNGSSSYVFARLDQRRETVKNLEAALDVLRQTGTPTANIRLNDWGTVPGNDPALPAPDPETLRQLSQLVPEIPEVAGYFHMASLVKLNLENGGRDQLEKALRAYFKDASATDFARRVGEHLEKGQLKLRLDAGDAVAAGPDEIFVPLARSFPVMAVEVLDAAAQKLGEDRTSVVRFIEAKGLGELAKRERPGAFDDGRAGVLPGAGAAIEGAFGSALGAPPRRRGLLDVLDDRMKDPVDPAKDVAGE